MENSGSLQTTVVIGVILANDAETWCELMPARESLGIRWRQDVLEAVGDAVLAAVSEAIDKAH